MKKRNLCWVLVLALLAIASVLVIAFSSFRHRPAHAAPVQQPALELRAVPKSSNFNMAAAFSRLEHKLDIQGAKLAVLLKATPEGQNAADEAADAPDAAVPMDNHPIVDFKDDCLHLWKWDDPEQWSGSYDHALEWAGPRSPQAKQGVKEHEKVISLTVINSKRMPRHRVVTNGVTPSQTLVHRAGEQMASQFHKQDCATVGSKMLFVHRRYDAASTNPWHRLAGVHSIWFALRAALWRIRYSPDVIDSISSMDILFLDKGEARRTVSGMKDRQKWAQQSGYMGALYGALGKMQDDWSMDILTDTPNFCEYSTVILAPDDGLLWDLAWDRKQGCLGSHPTWPLFVHDLRHGVGLPSFGDSGEHGELDVHVCWVSRDGTTDRKERTTDDEVVRRWIESTCQAGKAVKYKKLQFTSANSIREQAETLSECDVLMGIHGAGILNHMFMEPGSAVVELLPNSDIAYYRNTAHFSDHIYFSRQICKQKGNDFFDDKRRLKGDDQCVGIERGPKIDLREPVFREVLEAAIGAVSHKGRRHNDGRVRKC